MSTSVLQSFYLDTPCNWNPILNNFYKQNETLNKQGLMPFLERNPIRAKLIINNQLMKKSLILVT